MNISLPEKLKKEIERAVEKGAYSSKSEFIRDLLRLWKDKEWVKHMKEVEEARKEVREGKFISQEKLFKKLGV